MTFEGLRREAFRLSDWLQRDGTTPVIVSAANAIDFAVSFMACLFAGRIAVPAPPPLTPALRQRAFDIRSTLGPCRILGGAAERDAWSNAGHSLVCWRALPQQNETGPQPGPFTAQADDIAFIQFSSGSVGAPKGIPVSHANLAANCAMIQSAFGVTKDDINVSWLPLFHDMGLVGTLLQPLYTGVSSFFLPTLGFVQRPRHWLDAISRFKATIIGAPSFGYELCTRRISEPPADLDLSSVRIAFCGAERVQATILDRFAARFAPVGFQATSFLPCYGMAETTLISTCAPVGRGIATAPSHASPTQPASHYVSCGAAVKGCSVIVVSAQGHPVDDGHIGEVCIAGPHVTTGQWNPQSQSVEPDKGRLMLNDVSYFKTSDLGFLRQGALYPVARLDDLLSVNARNIYAGDLEERAMSLDTTPAVQRVAAFQPEDDNRIVLLAEFLRKDWDLRKTAVSALTQDLSRRFGASVTVTAVPRGALVLTSSGKIARHHLAETLRNARQHNDI